MGEQDPTTLLSPYSMTWSPHSAIDGPSVVQVLFLSSSLFTPSHYDADTGRRLVESEGGEDRACWLKELFDRDPVHSVPMSSQKRERETLAVLFHNPAPM